MANLQLTTLKAALTSAVPKASKGRQPLLALSALLRSKTELRPETRQWLADLMDDSSTEAFILRLVRRSRGRRTTSEEANRNYEIYRFVKELAETRVTSGFCLELTRDLKLPPYKFCTNAGRTIYEVTLEGVHRLTKGNAVPKGFAVAVAAKRFSSTPGKIEKMIATVSKSLGQ